MFLPFTSQRVLIHKVHDLVGCSWEVKGLNSPQLRLLGSQRQFLVMPQEFRKLLQVALCTLHSKPLLWLLISTSVLWSGTHISLDWHFTVHWAWPSISVSPWKQFLQTPWAAPFISCGPVSPTSVPGPGPLSMTCLHKQEPRCHFVSLHGPWSKASRSP